MAILYQIHIQVVAIMLFLPFRIYSNQEKVNGVDTKNGEALTATSFINREFKYIYN